MRVQVFQHVSFEGSGSIGPWLDARGVAVGVTAFYQRHTVPDVAEIDGLVVMGGPMSVNDEQGYPWLVHEKRVIGEMIARGKPVLGVCLGAQMIANVLGAKVYPNPEKEIGWFPVRATPSSPPSRVFGFPDECLVFHWHGETFDLPRNAVRLAATAACRNQAFQYGVNVIGLQFHLETTPGTARELVAHCRGELVPAAYVQSEAAILSAPAERYARINGLMSDVLAYLLPDRPT